MTLARDSHLVNVPLLDEDAVGFVLSTTAERTDVARTVGRPLPSGSTRRVVTFRGIDGDVDILRYWQAGGALRVFRNYPAVVTAWSTSNDEGYDDIVPLEAEAVTWDWQDPYSMDSIAFVLEGIASTP